MLNSLLERLRARRISPQEIRIETFALGSRHLGQVLRGAELEMKEPGVTARRVDLLKAVMHEQKQDL